MTKPKITLKQIKNWSPCEAGFKRLIKQKPFLSNEDYIHNYINKIPNVDVWWGFLKAYEHGLFIDIKDAEEYCHFLLDNRLTISDDYDVVEWIIQNNISSLMDRVILDLRIWEYPNVSHVLYLLYSNNVEYKYIKPFEDNRDNYDYSIMIKEFMCYHNM